MKSCLLVFFILWFGVQFQCVAQKKSIDYKIFDQWKDVENASWSNDGKWISFEINPQKGDGMLYLMNIENSRRDSFPRAHSAKFTPGSDMLVFKIKAKEDSVKKAKLAKKKDDDLPKDSIGILNLKKDSLRKFANVKSFKVAKEEQLFLAYLLEKEAEKKEEKKDTTQKKEAKPKKDSDKKKKKKSETWDLFVLNQKDFKTVSFKDVNDYTISENGKLIAFSTLKKDSIGDSCFVHIFDPKEYTSKVVFKNRGTAKKLFADKQGEQLAFLFSSDTVKNKSYSLKYWSEKKSNVVTIVDSTTAGLAKNWHVSENGEHYFSKEGGRIICYTSLKPEKEKKDSIPDDEKVKLDIWNWKDSLLQPNQLVDLEKEQKRAYMAMYFIETGKYLQLASPTLENISLIKKGDGNIGFGYDYNPYQKLVSWLTDPFKDVYTVDINTAKREKVLEKVHSIALQSNDGNYLTWYNENDSIWYLYDVVQKKHRPFTKGMSVSFFDEEYDECGLPSPYGCAGWSADNKSVLIYDDFDIWQFSVDEKIKPVNLTNGRTKKISYRYVRLDPEEEGINLKEPMLLKSVNKDSKVEGYYTFSAKSKTGPQQLMEGEFRLSTPVKAKNAEIVYWKKSNIQLFPNLWISNLKFSNARQISDANPQQKDYKWATVEPVKWKTFEGKQLDGLLYKPEDFNAAKKYPMIVYFYERNSQNIFQHQAPRPSRSVINPVEYASNDYLIFIPDITYDKKNGRPGQDAYDAIVSGTDYLISKGFVDEKNIGLQGQSWGGYQTAFLITQTNKYKAAMAGAAVANMTSAYGGIRWGSGLSRMMQYEDGQSRIDGTLWEKREKYIENSPLFFADKINTPLLLMNNDNDGAVPWYQGIELFTALRRLNKPCWLLNYNGEDHNLKKRHNAMDLNIRMRAFFDHYLKGAPAPEWMEKGIPASSKGKTMAY